MPGAKAGTNQKARVRHVTVKNERIKEIEEKIADLKARWPAHSVPPRMWQQLEELEAELLKEKNRPDDNG